MKKPESDQSPNVGTCPGTTIDTKKTIAKNHQNSERLARPSKLSRFRSTVEIDCIGFTTPVLLIPVGTAASGSRPADGAESGIRLQLHAALRAVPVLLAHCRLRRHGRLAVKIGRAVIGLRRRRPVGMDRARESRLTTRLLQGIGSILVGVGISRLYQEHEKGQEPRD